MKRKRIDTNKKKEFVKVLTVKKSGKIKMSK
jgi:hypothetical protein